MNYKAADIGAEVKKITNGLGADVPEVIARLDLLPPGKTVVRVCSQ